jgi:hypothetical protein
MNKEEQKGGFIILTFALGVIAIMYMFAFHSEREKNRELENKIQKISIQR